MIQDEAFENPLLLDLFNVASAEKHTYELPFYFKGDLMESNIAFVPKNNLTPAGESQGYQHLWLEATGKADEQSAQVNWFKKDVFYTLTTASQNTDEYAVGRIGANDPNFNLRRDPVYMIKRAGTSSGIFASVLEVHGTYSPVDERPINPYGKIKNIEVLVNTKEYTVVRFGNGTDKNWEFAIANNDASQTKKHELAIGDRTWSWTGVYQLSKLNKEK
jgi:oligo-alginate lyase